MGLFYVVGTVLTMLSGNTTSFGTVLYRVPSAMSADYAPFSEVDPSGRFAGIAPASVVRFCVAGSCASSVVEAHLLEGRVGDVQLLMGSRGGAAWLRAVPPHTSWWLMEPEHISDGTVLLAWALIVAAVAALVARLVLGSLVGVRWTAWGPGVAGGTERAERGGVRQIKEGKASQRHGGEDLCAPLAPPVPLWDAARLSSCMSSVPAGTARLLPSAPLTQLALLEHQSSSLLLAEQVQVSREC
jgi:hypothetical protein